MKTAKIMISDKNRNDNILEKVESDPVESNRTMRSENVIVGKLSRFLFTGNFLALRILFLDLLIVFCKLSSYFLEGYSLIMTPGKRSYGIITLGIIWTPGIVAAIHLISAYRRELPCQRTILYAILLIIFYPIVPILALLHLLWRNPKGEKHTKEFHDAQHGATVSYVIQGCIASSLQLCYQVWLVLNGVITLNNSILELKGFRLSDWQGNEVTIEYSAPLVIFFSILS